MAPYDPVTNPMGGALWEYLGANVRNADGSAALPETWIEDFGDVRVGFVGAVTDHLDELVSPAGIAGLTIEAPVVAANRHADELKAAGADIVILLVHEKLARVPNVVGKLAAEAKAEMVAAGYVAARALGDPAKSAAGQQPFAVQAQWPCRERRYPRASRSF